MTLCPDCELSLNRLTDGTYRCRICGGTFTMSGQSDMTIITQSVPLLDESDVPPSAGQILQHE